MSNLDGLAIEPLNLEQLMTIEEPTWLVEGLVSSSITLLTGQPKSGKSSVAQNLIAAALMGRDFLGRPMETIDRAIVLATDGGARMEYRDRLLELGVTPEAGRGLQLYTAAGVNEEVLSAMSAQLRPTARDLIVIDHFSSIDGDYNSQVDVNRVFRQIQSAAGAAAVVILAHSSTVRNANGHAPQKALGSTVIEAKARWILHVDRNGDRIRLSARGNARQSERLTLNVGSSAAELAVTDTSSAADQSVKQREKANKVEAERREQRDWYLTNCQGLTNTEAAEKLSAEFGGAMATWRNRLAPRGYLGILLAKD